LLAWASTAIGEPAARPKRIYPIEAIPVTAIGKHYKPALATDAAARAAADILTEAGLPGAHVTAACENGQPVITVTGADPSQVSEALAGFALTIRALP
jgi:fatty-acyl-CoA synthase